MSKHTPGPWRGYKDQGVYVGDGFDHPIFETGCGCCTQTDLTEANAILIAAAPDLLAALQSMVVAFAPPEFEREGASDEYLMDWFPEWFKARAAIAKATGKQT